MGREDIVPCVTYLCSAVELILVYSAQVTVQKCCLSHETGVTTDTEQLLALGFLLILIWTRHSYHDLGQSQGHPLQGTFAVFLISNNTLLMYIQYVKLLYTEFKLFMNVPQEHSASMEHFYAESLHLIPFRKLLHQHMELHLCPVGKSHSPPANEEVFRSLHTRLIPNRIIPSCCHKRDAEALSGTAALCLSKAVMSECLAFPFFFFFWLHLTDRTNLHLI